MWSTQRLHPGVVAETEQRLGPITLLINNAGQFRAFGRIGDVDPLEWWNEVEVNLKGPLLYAHAVLTSMRARRQGRIINVASIAAEATGHAYLSPANHGRSRSWACARCRDEWQKP